MVRIWQFHCHDEGSIPFPGGTNSKEPACQCGRQKRHKLDPWIREILCRREWQPTPVFLPGQFHGQRSLTGYSSWGYKELDMTEQLSKQENMLFGIIELFFFHHK